MAAEKATGTVHRSTHFGVITLDGKYQVKDDAGNVQYCFKTVWDWSCHPQWEIELYQALGYVVEQGPEGPYGFEEYDHNTYDPPCEACGGTDPLPGGPGADHLICEGCQTLWHGRCLNPPVLGTPDGDWYCHACNKYKA